MVTILSHTLYSHTRTTAFILVFSVIVTSYFVGLNQAGTIISSFLSMTWCMVSTDNYFLFPMKDRGIARWAPKVGWFMCSLMLTGMI